MKHLNQYINIRKKKSFIKADDDSLIDIIMDQYEIVGPEGDYNHIDVSACTTLCFGGEGVFEGLYDFNGDVTKWNVSNITNMKNTFYKCRKFNSDLTEWDVSNVTVFDNMFRSCSKFNGNISNWNISDDCTSMEGMFEDCYEFNQDISGWNVSGVEEMFSIFYNCKKFNQPLGGWEANKVKNLSHAFHHCNSFDQDLSSWCDKLDNLDFFDATFVDTPIETDRKFNPLLSGKYQ